MVRALVAIQILSTQQGKCQALTMLQDSSMNMDLSQALYVIQARRMQIKRRLHIKSIACNPMAATMGAKLATDMSSRPQAIQLFPMEAKVATGTVDRA